MMLHWLDMCKLSPYSPSGILWIIQCVSFFPNVNWNWYGSIRRHMKSTGWAVIVNGWQLSDRYHDCSKRIQHGTIQSCLGYGASQLGLRDPWRRDVQYTNRRNCLHRWLHGEFNLRGHLLKDSCCVWMKLIRRVTCKLRLDGCLQLSWMIQCRNYISRISMDLQPVCFRNVETRWDRGS